MPLLGNQNPEPDATYQEPSTEALRPFSHRKQSQHSNIAIAAMMHESSAFEGLRSQGERDGMKEAPLPHRSVENSLAAPPYSLHQQSNGTGAALTDTPATTAPNSPRM